MVDKLQSRGLEVASPDFVHHCLKTIGYYRLSAYFMPFYQNLVSLEENRFTEGTAFENIWSLYVFDKALRLLVSDALETIEIALRASLTDVMSVRYGAHWYTESQHFAPNDFFKLFIGKVNQICKKSDEVFLKHYFKKYDEPQYPPSWMMMECLSFGTCVKVLINLHTLADRRAICEIFGGHPTLIESWLGALCYTRNLCAHHARLWNRWFVVTPKRAQGDPVTWKTHSFSEQCHIMARLLKSIDSGRALAWKSELFNLFEKSSHIAINRMGFTLDWRQDLFWEI